MTHPTMIDSGQMNMVPESRAGNDSLHILFLGAPATAAIPAHSVQICPDDFNCDSMVDKKKLVGSAHGGVGGIWWDDYVYYVFYF